MWLQLSCLLLVSEPGDAMTGKGPICRVERSRPSVSWNGVLFLCQQCQSIPARLFVGSVWCGWLREDCDIFDLFGFSSVIDFCTLFRPGVTQSQLECR